MNTDKEVYQLQNGLYVEEKTTTYGGHLVYSDYVALDDPDKIDPLLMDQFNGSPEHKIPSFLWNQMVTFFFKYLADHTEVEARYYKRNADFICIIGKQLVTGASVDYDYSKPLYGLDGVCYTRETLVAGGWVLYGHFHLHPFDMPNPSGTDDNGKDGKGGELKLPLLYGIISIPSNRPTQRHYRIRTTVVSHNGYKNQRYFTNAWDFIDLQGQTEIQELQETPYSLLCESQVTKFVWQQPKQKWLQPLPSKGLSTITTYTVKPKILSEKLKTALKNILLFDTTVTVADIEKELPSVLSDLLSVDNQYAEELFTYDSTQDDYNDPFYCQY